MPQYSDYILVSGTTETIKKNTKGSRYVVSDDGVLVISSGGTLNWSDSTDHYIMYGGKVYVCSGGTACGGTYLVSGSCYVYAGGIASSPEISDSSWFVVSSGGRVYNAQISSGGIMDVKSSGFAYFTTVSGGAMHVYHYASTTFVYSGGIVRVGSGATLIDTTVNRDGAVTVSSGGTALSTYIYPGASAALYGIAYYNHISSGRMSVMSGGYANTNDVKSGVLDVFSGGTVTSNQITSGGVMNVSKGGLASKTTIFMYGSAYIGGTASGTVMSGGWMDLFGSSYNGVYSSGVVSIGYGGYSYNEVFSNTRTYVLCSGSASGIVYGGTLGSGCSVIISGGRFGGKTVSNAVFDILCGYADVSALNGAVARVKGGTFNAYAGGTMTSAAVSGYGSAMGKMYVMSAATVKNVDVYANAHLGIMIGGSVTSAYAGLSSGSDSASIGVSSGGKLGTASIFGELEIGSGGSVTSAIIASGGKGTVSGTLNYAFIHSGSPLQISSGGLVSSAVVSSGARINVNGGTLNSAAVASKATLSINSNGSVGSATVYGSAIVNYAGKATGVKVFDGGVMHVSGSAVARNYRLDSGTALVFSGGSVLSGTIYSGGRLDVYSGGIANSCTVASSGKLRIFSGGMLSNINIQSAGRLTGTYNCSNFIWSAGAIADMDITGLMPGNSSAFVSNLNYAKSKSADFTLSVYATQTNGTYKLASGAAGFDRTITVKNYENGATLGLLRVGQTASVGGVSYRLDLGTDNVLSVTVGAAAPSGSAKSDIDGNGISDVMFVWTGNNYAHGYWMNGTNTWQSANSNHPAEWDNLGCHDMNANGKADSVLFGNVTSEAGIHGAYIGYYADAIDNPDGSTWVNIGYLTNEDNIDWKNTVGNLTGNAGRNSIVWYTYQLGALGVWTDGTENWVSMGSGFDATWTLIGCGDFNGDGKDQVVMSHNSGAEYHAIDIGGTWTSLGVSDSGWEVRAIGDFAGDGKDDIVAFHAETGIVAMWIDGVNSVTTWMQLGQLDAKDWFVVGAGDYNGDAKDDLLVRQYSTGMLGYYSSGDMTNGWVELGRGVDMNWTVIA